MINAILQKARTTLLMVVIYITNTNTSCNLVCDTMLCSRLLFYVDVFLLRERVMILQAEKYKCLPDHPMKEKGKGRTKN